MVETPAAGGLKLPHGYTNVTTLSAGVVRKSYPGPAAQQRLRVERAALSGLAGRFPVPAIVPGGDGELYVQAVAGWHGQEALAVVDWEWCHRGSAIEDLAWAEWIVRMHHRAAPPHLGELFAGYGDRPAWPERKAAMLRICRRYREFSRQWPNPDAARMWEERTATTEAFRQ